MKYAYSLFLLFSLCSLSVFAMKNYDQEALKNMSKMKEMSDDEVTKSMARVDLIMFFVQEIVSNSALHKKDYKLSLHTTSNTAYSYERKSTQRYAYHLTDRDRNTSHLMSKQTGALYCDLFNKKDETTMKGLYESIKTDKELTEFIKASSFSRIKMYIDKIRKKESFD